MMRLFDSKKLIVVIIVALLTLLPVAACAPKAAEPPPQPPAPPAGTIAAEPSKIDMATLKANFEIFVKLRRYTPEVAAKVPVQIGLLVLPVMFVGEGWPANEMVLVDLVIPPDVEMKGLDRSRGEDSIAIAVGTADSQGRFETIMESAAKLNWLLRSDWLPTLTPDLSTMKPLPTGTYTIRATGIDPRTVATATWYLELSAPAK